VTDETLTANSEQRTAKSSPVSLSLLLDAGGWMIEEGGQRSEIGGWRMENGGLPTADFMNFTN